LAVAASDYAAGHSLAMADAMIYATAMKGGADLLTCEARLANLPGVVYFAKAPSP
jgi:predicted nucleic acid-binding protein